MTDLELRNRTYALFVQLGRAPLPEGPGARDEVLAGWSRLDDAHALVLWPDRAQIRMLNPFSGVPTAHRVRAGGRWWYGNCAWDAFGICAALGVEGRIESSCPDCGEALAVESDRPGELLFHCLVPATSWWSDIGFT
jgi:hypothetical protein